jgi:hypothetical protein
MDHVTAREVDGACSGEPTAAPETERSDRVDTGHPSRDEEDPCLKLIRPRTEPARIMTVIAANTNWKYTIVDMGKVRVRHSDAVRDHRRRELEHAGAAGLGLPRNGEPLLSEGHIVRP